MAWAKSDNLLIKGKKSQLAILFVLMVFLLHCGRSKQTNNPIDGADQLAANIAAAGPYASLHDTTQYVGPETCRSCHTAIYESFMQTGMGESWGLATRQKSKAKFDHHIAVFDSLNQLYYHPYWRNDSLFIKEFRINPLNKKDTVYQQSQYIQYIIGSGHHTNSHIYAENGYLYQAPITFYTQKGIWDLAPGFSGGFSSRFNRTIGHECMACHNSFPAFDLKAENKYQNVPHGISCERCHGPGQAHVQQKLANIVVDTATTADYTIVNPRKLPTRELQMNVCQRCHLQGVTILAPGKTFTDYRPAMPLNSIMEVFLPEFDGAETHFIMASQAHRLTKSACYKKSQMTCTTCHNPHKSVRQTDPSIFNAKCQNCHAQTNNNTHAENNCSLPLNQRTATNNNNCFACHMPVSPSIDIPHVTVHDHFIRKPISEAEKQKVQHFIGLKSVLSPNNTQALTKAKAYIHFYESYQAKKSHLDSAALFMEIATKSHQPQQQYPDYLDTQVHLYYLQQKFTELINIAQNTSPKTIKNAWTAYRLGEAYLQTNQPQLALNWLQQAVSLLPLQPDFDSKLAATQVQLSQFDAAKTRLEALLKEHPHHTASLSNLGFVYASTGNLPRADSLYHAALACNPNYVPAMLNLAGLELLKRNNTAALKYAQQALKAQPNNTQAQQLVQQLRGKL